MQITRESKYIIGLVLALGVSFATLLAHLFTKPSLEWVYNHHATPFFANKFMLGGYLLVEYLSFLLMIVPLLMLGDQVNDFTFSIIHTSIWYNVFVVFTVWAFTREKLYWTAFFSLCLFSSSFTMYGQSLRLRNGFVEMISMKLPSKLVFGKSLWFVVYAFSAALHCTGIGCRVFSNVFIWFFAAMYLVPILGFHDWALSLVSAYLFLSIGIGQMFIHLFALQHIFAFIIAGLMTLFAALLFLLPYRQRRAALTGESAPLLQDNNAGPAV
ncbi:hypothetical protein POMI540_3556 [Schizosaccharomyces pombe]|uniref:Uncharacterized protein C637.03 n=1 Tax=Schizosaccharomyces pombe (strain 972 / ATCC 24843) TaxID=284812 RepID=YFE3_SCHPO|nr:uncharacterized protein SPAC637.03 [Schizosaccharomyces pombe]O94440.1 RecName: Full=Uncharacterized protein C637.03 [Schizosaccharomyces pombe 972h-]CAA22582.1 conserved fungal protein [Schizosaccharomyces pombe]|eukprot:NP_594621.1 uncharacterized protein SPAC637.03 [Schizosaccharomyces pombe]